MAGGRWAWRAPCCRLGNGWRSDGGRARGAERAGGVRCADGAHATRTPPRARQRRCRAVTLAWRSHSCGTQRRGARRRKPAVSSRPGRTSTRRTRCVSAQLRALAVLLLNVSHRAAYLARSRTYELRATGVCASRYRCRRLLAASCDVAESRHRLRHCASLCCSASVALRLSAAIACDGTELGPTHRG